eukprot:TRINITY_DN19060_c0_g1_i2.p1 TRINITY_DN19060_c0_g1~~TRINITY_DN19060_c0_g1_i2.p1  ORF type:complete len:333 (-),score=44.90 TRINITY_DN19060_c0_g1_i2:102-1100(-)
MSSAPSTALRALLQQKLLAALNETVPDHWHNGQTLSGDPANGSDVVGLKGHGMPEDDFDWTTPEPSPRYWKNLPPPSSSSKCLPPDASMSNGYSSPNGLAYSAMPVPSSQVWKHLPPPSPSTEYPSSTSPDASGFRAPRFSKDSPPPSSFTECLPPDGYASWTPSTLTHGCSHSELAYSAMTGLSPQVWKPLLPPSLPLEYSSSTSPDNSAFRAPQLSKDLPLSSASTEYKSSVSPDVFTSRTPSTVSHDYTPPVYHVMPVSVFYLTGNASGPFHYGPCIQQNPVPKQPVSAESDNFAQLKEKTDQEAAEIMESNPEENEGAVERLSSASLI